MEDLFGLDEIKEACEKNIDKESFVNQFVRRIPNGWGHYLVVFPEERFNGDYEFCYWFDYYDEALERALENGSDFFIYMKNDITTLFTDEILKSYLFCIEYRDRKVYDYWVHEDEFKQLYERNQQLERIYRRID